MAIEAAHSNDQWIIIDGLGDSPGDLTALLLGLIEDLDFKRS